MDVHTHHVMPDGPWRQAAPAMEEMIQRLVPDGCTAPDPLECLDRAHYVHDLFLASDTTVAMLTDVPNSGPADAPVPYAENLGTAQFAASLAAGSAPRVLPQVVLAPNFGPIEAALDGVTAQVETGRPASFKAYTAWGPDGRGYSLVDPMIGLPVIERIQDLGGRVICAHKGLPLQGFDLAQNGPDDLVAAAKLFPSMQFVVYHSAYERELTEGPYDPASAGRGTSSLLAALDRHGIPPNANVWCELGTTWREVLSHPNEAAHVLGKLLTRVGEDRVLWGTDAIWYGSPQPQIMAFRVFEIAPELQEQYGYPALTPAAEAQDLRAQRGATPRPGHDGDLLRAHRRPAHRGPPGRAGTRPRRARRPLAGARPAHPSRGADVAPRRRHAHDVSDACGCRRTATLRIKRGRSLVFTAMLWKTQPWVMKTSPARPVSSTTRAGMPSMSVSAMKRALRCASPSSVASSRNHGCESRNPNFVRL